MRGNGTPRGQAELVAARVQALLAVESPDPPDSYGAAPPDGDRAQVDDIAPDAFAFGDVMPDRVVQRPVRAEPSWWDRLSARVPVRLDPGRRGALAVGIAVLIAALVAGAWLMSNRPQAVPVSASVPTVPGAGPLVGTDGVTEGASGSASAAGSPSGSAAGTTASDLVVDVSGKVRHPGVYHLPAGSRVDAALRAAGGVRGQVDLSKLNLAAVLVDGQQVPVGVPAAVGGAPPAGGATAPAGSSATVVDINTATLEQLETLPGVGPVLGQDILDYRDAHGSFSSINQLEDVSGIGDVTFGDLKSLVTV